MLGLAAPARGRAGLVLRAARQSIPYSEFKTLVRGGQVAEITVGDQTIRGTSSSARRRGSAQQFSTTRIEDPKLVEDLEARSEVHR